MKRIYTIETVKKVGEEVMLEGWVQRIRDHGKLLFVDLRDWKGIVQVVMDSENPEFREISKSLGNEYVIKVEGKVVKRQTGLENPKILSGEIEIEAKNIQILSESKTLPFSVDTNGHEIEEQIRLKYRFLDIRRPRMQEMLAFRNELIYFVRTWYKKHGFVEIETPLLTVTSPEGARDFIVPSRVHRGKFYVLPQAPQQFKQLLMVGGIEKYFQIAPCFRDEDPRADRHAGAFYQIDTEMSFITQEDLFNEMEPLFKEMIEQLTDKKIMQYPFPRIPYKVALEEYGSDKPDLRFGLKLQNLDFLKDMTSFTVFEKADRIKGIVLQNATLSRKQIDELGAMAIQAGGKGLAWMRRKEDGQLDGPIAKFIPDVVILKLEEEHDMKPGSLLLISADTHEVVNKVLNIIRLYLGDMLSIRDKNIVAFAWITDFPMYEWNEKDNKLDFMHNPFSMPQGGYEALMSKDSLDILAYQYDIVANGLELSSGAIRNHEPETMIKAFEIAGYTREEVISKFHHMIDAFSYGAPPHGGFAPGVDRLVMLLRDEPNIREIYAFPLSSDAKDIMMNAPSEISQKQLEDVGLTFDEKTKKLLAKGK